MSFSPTLFNLLHFTDYFALNSLGYVFSTNQIVKLKIQGVFFQRDEEMRSLTGVF